MSNQPKSFRNGIGKHFSGSAKPERDFVVLGIAIAAIILFIGTGGTVLPRMVAAWRGLASQPDVVMTNALILNIAVILLGWNRYRHLRAQLDEKTRAEEEARHLAEIDPLTGCYNRRSFGPAVDELTAEANLCGQAVALILVDLDNFKQINDLHGHKTGDDVLVATSDRIGDILPAQAVLARLGGDEFAFALPFDPQTPERIEHLAALLIEKVAEPHTVDGGEVEVTMSVGVVSSKVVIDAFGADELASRLIHKADIAMYQAKKRGKNRFFWFEPAMEQELRFRNELEAGIRKGVANGEFVPFYEQQVDLDTGELVGFEMLARWQSPELGTINPDIFIPIAEEIGLIADMSESLMIRAFEDAKSWHPDLTLSVNISPVQLRDPWFSQKLLKLLIQHNFPPSRLDIEITESCLHDNIGMVRTIITSLRNQGVRVSLDDFGTGYASLSQLRSLPFDRLKIDRSFISELNNREAGHKLVDAIISMGDGLNMPITAEGIENEDILDLLKKMGRLKGQGYHYGKPEPAERVAQRLAEKGLLVDREDARHADSEDESRRRSGAQAL